MVVPLSWSPMETACSPYRECQNFGERRRYTDLIPKEGAGSGGAIRLQGGSISCLGTLEAKSSPTFALHAGGGGRIAIQTNGNLLLSTVDLSGYRPGTLHISGATATPSLNFSSGTLSLDTTYGYWHHTSGVHGTGVWNKRTTTAFNIKPVPSLLTPSIWHPDQLSLCEERILSFLRPATMEISRSELT